MMKYSKQNVLLILAKNTYVLMVNALISNHSQAQG